MCEGRVRAVDAVRTCRLTVGARVRRRVGSGLVAG